MSAVTLPVPSEFERFCQRARLSPEQVLVAFMSDLTEPPRSVGREGPTECHHARKWFATVTRPAVARVA
ncbi:TPA: hypothetical protein KCN18_004142 [Escherichia coli]|jgi:hypothetical protein|nr:hypothetical protein [Escherichia coli]HBB7752685.1 hypothetical protein [Escherichia coli]HBB7832139.1 hypothetical protein [Escherichia coli]HBB7860081.1 hypothetical protein [Escherichia coli]